MSARSDMSAPPDTAADQAETAATGEKGAGWARWLPLAALAAGAIAGVSFFGEYLSFDALKENREALLAWRDANLIGALLTFAALYAAAVAFSVPGALWLTLGGGFLFGTVIAGPVIVLAATGGATAIFLAARTSLGAALRDRAGPWLERLRGGVEENAVSFMLVLRLVPAVPFFIANLAPAFLGVPLRTYVWTTFVGIVPGTLVYTSVGAGLGAVIDTGGEPDLGIIFEPHVLGPLLGLAALAALPALLKKRRPADADA